MVDQFCVCFHEAFVDFPVHTWSTSLEFGFVALITVLGIRLNYKFLSKLKKERRETPIGRKGNVIDPIMRGFLIFQIILRLIETKTFTLNLKQKPLFDEKINTNVKKAK